VFNAYFEQDKDPITHLIIFLNQNNYSFDLI
jgi:hypothetical protein